MTQTSQRPLRVLAAMSGGVDSAVAAARAAEAGHDVTGVHLALSANPQSFRTGARGCCTIEDSRDARRAADVIGIPFYVWDLAERFREDVVDDFVAEYEAGRTPNPCLRCNEKIKFAALLDKALALGFDAVCTGHYATVVLTEDGSRELHRASDMAKDQSYVLGVLDEKQLAHAMFPLGDTLTTKDEIRAEAERRGLAVAKKPDSHDICFIADGDTQGFLANRLGGPAEGDILDESGAKLGTHEGAFGFTIGQRKGLKIGHPAPDGKPRYVLDISPVNNTVTVGPVEALDVTSLTAIKPRWCGTPRPAPVRTPPSSAPTAARPRSRPSWWTAPSCTSPSPSRSGASPPARRSSCTTARAWSARPPSPRPCAANGWRRADPGATPFASQRVPRAVPLSRGAALGRFPDRTRGRATGATPRPVMRAVPFAAKRVPTSGTKRPTSYQQPPGAANMVRGGRQVALSERLNHGEEGLRDAGVRLRRFLPRRHRLGVHHRQRRHRPRLALTDTRGNL